MSHIFDALQRSEGDSLGVDLAVPSEATELLQRAERKATSKWETAILVEQSLETQGVVCNTSFGLQETQLGAEELETPMAPVSSPTNGSSDIFNQFQPLQIMTEPQSRMVCITDNESPAAEGFRLLGVRLRHLRRDRPLKKVLITSTVPQEGKSMVAANLACTLALRTQQRTLLLEGDLRRSSLSQVFGLGRNPGLSECLEDQRTLSKSIYHLEGPGFWLLPAGSVPSNALELLQSGRLLALMNQLTAWFDWIIIDSPPVLPLADTSVWARLADGILLVTRQGTTEKRQLQRGIEALEPKKLIGALLDCSSTSAHSDYYYRASTVKSADK
jgi:capsular exopolysaccharide synthesis family protein